MKGLITAKSLDLHMDLERWCDENDGRFRDDTCIFGHMEEVDRGQRDQIVKIEQSQNEMTIEMIGSDVTDDRHIRGVDPEITDDLIRFEQTHPRRGTVGLTVRDEEVDVGLL